MGESKRPRVLLVSPLDPASERRLADAAEVVRPATEDAGSLLRAVAGCAAIIVRTHTRISRELLAAGAGVVKVVGVAGVGVDRVDLAAAAELGIAVEHMPAAATHAVAEFTLALMLELLRPIRSLSARYAAGDYAGARRESHGDELASKTVGIVGMGRIGSRVARLCGTGFGARVLYNDIRDVGPFEFPAESVEKPALWAEADLVTLHVPLTSQTRRMIDAGTLGRMRPGAMLINTARGEVVDTAALCRALDEGALAGAALDVTDPEPLPSQHPLFSQPRCILTPHVAARTHTGLRNMYGIVDVVLARLNS